ncbi:MAG: hypothetical protein VB092_00855 [Oscillospiraceae bacterium]|nr:hypothetical protein [Oscillospiraceae bacterium]
MYCGLFCIHPSYSIREQIVSSVAKNPAYALGTVLMIAGILILIAGVVLAIRLKKKSSAK